MHKKALLIGLLLLTLPFGCTAPAENSNTTATSTVSPPIEKELTVVPRPQRIEELVRQRGEQDQAQPTLRVVSPANDSTVNGSTVEVNVNADTSNANFELHVATLNTNDAITVGPDVIVGGST